MTILSLHNLTRWVIFGIGLIILVKAAIGLKRKQDWKKGIIQNLRLYLIGLELQILIGFVLYIFLSPITFSALLNFGAAMKDPVMGYFSIVHTGLMIIALMLAHAGRRQVKKALTAARKYKQTLIWFGLSFLLLLLTIP